jgi:hypothetical protein
MKNLNKKRKRRKIKINGIIKMKKVKINNLFIILSSFLFFTILILFIFNYISKKDPSSDDNDFENMALKSGKTNKIFERKEIDHDLENKNVSLEPYGCFSNLKNQFFQERVNPYSKGGNRIISNFYITAGHPTKPLRQLIQNVIKNGYSKFGNSMLKKYNINGLNSITIIEIAKLAKLSGYNYISILKYPKGSARYGKIYLTYSPPTVSSSLYKYTTNFTDEEFNSILTDSDLPEYTLTPKLNNYTSETDTNDGKELSCGYPCITNDKPDTFTDSQGVVRQYMCGSVNYPTLKTPEHYAVYKIN